MVKASFLAELRAACLAHGLLVHIDRDPIETLLTGPAYRTLRHQPDPPSPRGGAKNKNRDKVKAARKQNRRQK